MHKSAACVQFNQIEEEEEEKKNGGGPLKAGNPTHNTRQNQRGWSNGKNTTKVEKGGSHKR